jgi:hypothetical protein
VRNPALVTLQRCVDEALDPGAAAKARVSAPPGSSLAASAATAARMDAGVP